jgi:hypothetical protein
MTEPNMEGGCACRQVRYQAVTTAYIFLGATLEERDLIRVFGDEYRAYRKRVAMLIPGRKSTELWSLIGKTTWHHAIKRGPHGIFGNVMETDCVG